MYFLDCKGKSCPLPVLETKKVIEEKGLLEVTVGVDNEVSRENVKRFLESRGYRTTVEGQGGSFSVIASKEGGRNPSAGTEAEAKKITAFIDSATLGRGDDQLGAILMKAFILTLKELNPLPWRIIFINGGVRLASVGSEMLPYLRELENLGVEILSCGTCLDFYGLKEGLKAGRVSNMFEIVTSLTDSSNVLKP
jgi:selenium metabolism protein YedF